MSKNSRFNRALHLLQSHEPPSPKLKRQKYRQESVIPASATRFGAQPSEDKIEVNDSEDDKLQLKIPQLRVHHLSPLKSINEAKNQGSASQCFSQQENRDFFPYSLSRNKSMVEYRKQKRCLRISRIVAIIVIGLFSVGFSLMLYLQKERLKTYSQNKVLREALDSAVWLGGLFAVLSTLYLMMLHRRRCFLFSAIFSMGIAALLVLAALFFPSFVRIPNIQLVPMISAVVIILSSSWLLSWTVVSIQMRLTPSFGVAGSSICSVITCLILGIMGISIPILLMTYSSTKKVSSDPQFQKLILHLTGIPISIILGLAVLLTISMLFFKYPHAFTSSTPHSRWLKLSQCILQLVFSALITAFSLFILLTQQQLLLDGEPKQKFTLYACGIGLPFLIIVGTKMIEAEGSYKIKYLTFPLFLFFPLNLVCNIMLHYASQMYIVLLEFSLIIIPVLGMLWSTLFCIFHRSRALCLLLLLILFCGILIPAFFIYPLFHCGITQYRTSSIVILALILLGLAILLFYEVYLFCRRAKKRKLCSLHQSYTYLGHWSNSTCFILGESLLLYVAFNHEIQSHSLRFAFIIGTIFSLISFFVITNIVLSLRTHKPKGDEDSTFFDYVFGRTFQSRSQIQQVKFRREERTQRRFATIIIVIFIITLPAILLPLGMFLPIDENISLAIIFCAIFSLICGILGVVSAQLKRKLGPYSKNGLPMCLTMIWSFVVLPFGALIPATTVMTQNMKGSQVTLLTLGLLIMVALLVLGTSVLSVLLNEVFKRLEYEHKAKLAVIRLYKSLKTIGVKGEPRPLRICVDQYIWKGKEALSKRLEAEDLVKCWELPPQDPDFTVSKVILTKELHGKVMK